MRPIGGARSGIVGSAGSAGSAIPDSGLAHRYDATKISGSDGDSVGTWTDTDGNDDLTQSTSSQQPVLRTNGINSKNILEFDGSDDVLDVDFSDLSQPVTVFVVARIRNTGNQVYYDGFSTDFFLRYQSQSADDYTFNAGSNLKSTNIGLDADPHILTTLGGGASSVIREDGAEKASGDAGSNVLDGLTVGDDRDSNEPASMDIGELLIYDTKLSDADRNSVESFLSDKWGIQI